ncbi:SDR family oxidoreductase [soil metagenome]
MRVDLGGRVAIFTGSTRGIGRAVARALAANGARVVIHGRNKPDADAVAAKIAAQGGTAHAYAGDLATTESVDGIVDATLTSFGRVDMLVNNAGLTSTFQPALDFSDERVDEILRVNLRAPILLALRVARWMAAHGGGSIVNLTSVGGSQRAHFDNAVYDAAKGGLDGLTRALAVDLGPSGIRVNAVGPAAVTDASTPEARGSDLPLRRGGTPDDIANAVLYLVSDAASFVTGQILYVDGGLMAQLRSPGARQGQGEVPR